MLVHLQSIKEEYKITIVILIQWKAEIMQWFLRTSLIKQEVVG